MSGYITTATPSVAMPRDEAKRTSMPFTQEAYAQALARQARLDGQFRRLPVNPQKVKFEKHDGALAEVKRAIVEGYNAAGAIAQHLGYKRQFVSDKLAKLKESGDVILVGNQWRIAK